MELPDGFIIEERYVSKEVAAADLDEYKSIMKDMFCPLSSKYCRTDCMFFSDGYVKANGDGTFTIVLPVCSIFLGGQG